MNKKLFIFLLICLLVYLLIFPREALQASARGVDLWFHTVLPTLLPFIILSGLLVTSGALLPLLQKADKICRVFPGLSGAGTYALVLGVLCGFPMGARTTAALLRENSISQREARLLLCVSNHVSPAFLAGYVRSLLPDPGWMPLAAGIYYGAAAAAFFLIRGRSRPGYTPGKKPKKKASTLRSPGELLDASIMDGCQVILKLGGYIILFSVCAEAVRTLSAGLPLLSPVCSMILEISSGTSLLLSAPFPKPLGMTLLLAGLSFGGLSTAAQTAGMIQGTGLPLSLYLKGKLLQAALAAAFTLLFFAVV